MDSTENFGLGCDIKNAMHVTIKLVNCAYAVNTQMYL